MLLIAVQLLKKVAFDYHEMEGMPFSDFFKRVFFWGGEIMILYHTFLIEENKGNFWFCDNTR